MFRMQVADNTYKGTDLPNFEGQSAQKGPMEAVWIQVLEQHVQR